MNTPARANRSAAKDQSHIPLPTNKKRGFWGTFFFWFGGVLCMYFVGRRVFQEQSHQRRTLRRLRDELGHFFPEFDPVNITKWVTIAADHVFYTWREGDVETLETFSTARFIETQETLWREAKSKGEQRTVHLNKILAVHTLGMEWKTRDDVEHPPLGVKLTLRVEVSAIDFTENTAGDLLSGKRKPQQFQWIWTLIHDGKSWTLDEVNRSQGDLTHLNQAAPLPEIASWRRPVEDAP